MIMARRTVIAGALVALGLGVAGGGAGSERQPATERSSIGDPAPVLTLARTGPTPGKLSLRELWDNSAAVLVFYRGEW